MEISDISYTEQNESKSYNNNGYVGVVDGGENNHSLDFSAIEPVVSLKRLKRLKLRRVRLLSDSSSDEETVRNSSTHSDSNEKSQNDDCNQFLPKYHFSESTKTKFKPTIARDSSNKEPGTSSNRPVRKYKFWRIQPSTTVTRMTKSIQRSPTDTKEIKFGCSSSNKNCTPCGVDAEIEICKDSSLNQTIASNSSTVVIDGKDCLVETILTTPRSKPSIESILEKDLSFSVDGFDSSLFNEEISPCVLSQQSTRGRNNDKSAVSRVVESSSIASMQATPIRTNKQQDPNAQIDTSPVCPLSPFGVTDKRYNFKKFRRTFRHYSPVGKRALRNLENISIDSDIIWPTP